MSSVPLDYLHYPLEDIRYRTTRRGSIFYFFIYLVSIKLGAQRGMHLFSIWSVGGGRGSIRYRNESSFILMILASPMAAVYFKFQDL